MPQTKTVIVLGNCQAQMLEGIISQASHNLAVKRLPPVFELTEQDPQTTRYDITVYALGWRLGGKGLVGRDTHADWRALEHGLHVWAGFYDNAFDLVQRLYARLERPPDAWRSIDASGVMQ